MHSLICSIFTTLFLWNLYLIFATMMSFYRVKQLFCFLTEYTIKHKQTQTHTHTHPCQKGGQKGRQCALLVIILANLYVWIVIKLWKTSCWQKRRYFFHVSNIYTYIIAKIVSLFLIEHQYNLRVNTALTALAVVLPVQSYEIFIWSYLLSRAFTT